MNEFQNNKSKIIIEKLIESKYILKDIFSFLCENQKLNIIIYNKHMQKQLDINIKDYIRISGKYKEGERNGKGKEYIKNTEILIFEGNYLKGRRNGKGKEYNFDGELRYEGEYLNGRRSGKGKRKSDFYYNDKPIYEGEIFL